MRARLRLAALALLAALGARAGSVLPQASVVSANARQLAGEGGNEGVQRYRDAVVLAADTLVKDDIPQPSEKTILGVEGSTRLFFSYATNYLPPSDGGPWTPRPDAVNPELVSASPDAEALAAALWHTAALATAAQLTNNGALTQRAQRTVQRMFAGSDALPPNFTYARVVPVTGRNDYRINPDGFQALDDVAVVLLDQQSLALDRASRAGLVAFARQYREWLTQGPGRAQGRLRPQAQASYIMQLAALSRFLDDSPALDAACEQGSIVTQQHIEADGALMHVDVVGIAPSMPAAHLSSLYRYAVLARACEASTSALWSLRGGASGAEQGRRLLQRQQPKALLHVAAERIAANLAQVDLAIPAMHDENVALRRALEALPILAAQYEVPALDTLNVRLLAYNPEAITDGSAAVAALRHLPTTHPWTVRAKPFSCDEARSLGAPCVDGRGGSASNEDGFWESAGGIALTVAIVVALLMALLLLLWLVRVCLRGCGATAGVSADVSKSPSTTRTYGKLLDSAPLSGTDDASKQRARSDGSITRGESNSERGAIPAKNVERELHKQAVLDVQRRREAKQAELEARAGKQRERETARREAERGAEAAASAAAAAATAAAAAAAALAPRTARSSSDSRYDSASSSERGGEATNELTTQLSDASRAEQKCSVLPAPPHGIGRCDTSTLAMYGYGPQDRYQADASETLPQGSGIEHVPGSGVDRVTSSGAAPLSGTHTYGSHPRSSWQGSQHDSLVSSASLAYAAPPPLSQTATPTHAIDKATRPPMSPPRVAPRTVSRPPMTTAGRPYLAAGGGLRVRDSSFMGAGGAQSTFMADGSASLMPDTTAALSEADADTTAVIRRRRDEESAADAALQEASAAAWVQSGSLVGGAGADSAQATSRLQRHGSDTMLDESRLSETRMTHSERLPGARSGQFMQPAELAGIYPMSSAGGKRYLEGSEMSTADGAVAQASASEFQLTRAPERSGGHARGSQSLMEPANSRPGSARAAPLRPPAASGLDAMPVPPPARRPPPPAADPAVPTRTPRHSTASPPPQPRSPRANVTHHVTDSHVVREIDEARLALYGAGGVPSWVLHAAHHHSSGGGLRRSDSLGRQRIMHRSGSLGPVPRLDTGSAQPSTTAARPSRGDWSPRESSTLRQRFSATPSPRSGDGGGADSELRSPARPCSPIPPSPNQSGYSAGDSEQLRTVASLVQPPSPLQRRGVPPSPRRPPIQPGTLPATLSSPRHAPRGRAALHNPFKAGSVAHDTVDSQAAGDALTRTVQSVDSDMGRGPLFDSTTRLLDYGGDIEGSEMIGGFDEDTALLGRPALRPTSRPELNDAVHGGAWRTDTRGVDASSEGGSTLSLPGVDGAYTDEVIYAHQDRASSLTPLPIPQVSAPLQPASEDAVVSASMSSQQQFAAQLTSPHPLPRTSLQAPPASFHASSLGLPSGQISHSLQFTESDVSRSMCIRLHTNPLNADSGEE